MNQSWLIVPVVGCKTSSEQLGAESDSFNELGTEVQKNAIPHTPKQDSNVLLTRTTLDGHLTHNKYPMAHHSFVVSQESVCHRDC